MKRNKILIPEFVIEEKPSITISDAIKLIDQDILNTVERSMKKSLNQILNGENSLTTTP